MGKQINLTLPDDIMRRAEVLVGRSGRQITDILTEAIEISLDPFDLPVADMRPPTDWSNEEVLAAADSTMPPHEDQRLSELLDRQQSQTLTGAERSELSTLMQAYQAGLMWKAQGVAEAVRRHLRGAPLS